MKPAPKWRTTCRVVLACACAVSCVGCYSKVVEAEGIGSDQRHPVVSEPDSTGLLLPEREENRGPRP